MRSLQAHLARALAALVAAGAVAYIGVACTDEQGPTYGSSYPTPSPPQVDASSVSANPILVDIDPNKTLTASPGDGVGVFVEYQTGGHWHVWWTCDTSKTKLNCVFDVKGTLDQGAFSNVTGQALEPIETLTTPTPGSFEAKTTTTTAVDGVHFDAPLGAVVTLDASIAGLRDGSFFFFVQNGKLNGGFTGHLTDPLRFEASTP